MGGWKTLVGGILAIAWGTAGCVYGFVGQQIALAFIMAGFAVFGITAIGLGHKLDKVKGVGKKGK